MKKMLFTYISLGTTMYEFFNLKNIAEINNKTAIINSNNDELNRNNDELNRKDNELNRQTNYQININTLNNDELNRKNDEFKLCVEYKKDFDECFKKFK